MSHMRHVIQLMLAIVVDVGNVMVCEMRDGTSRETHKPITDECIQRNLMQNNTKIEGFDEQSSLLVCVKGAGRVSQRQHFFLVYIYACVCFVLSKIAIFRIFF